MNTALDPDTVTEPDTTAPLACEHSAHHKGRSHGHGPGPATHYALAIHDCAGGTPTAYPACAEWVAYVRSRQDDYWLCRRCQAVDLGHNMCVILDPIT